MCAAWLCSSLQVPCRVCPRLTALSPGFFQVDKVLTQPNRNFGNTSHVVPLFNITERGTYFFYDWWVGCTPFGSHPMLPHHPRWLAWCGIGFIKLQMMSLHLSCLSSRTMTMCSPVAVCIQTPMACAP